MYMMLPSHMNLGSFVTSVEVDEIDLFSRDVR